MKRKAEFLVRKRDGRLQWLRSSKLARSIYLAIASAGGGTDTEGAIADGEDWRIPDLTRAVVVGLRSRLPRARILSTDQLAEAAVQVLQATGFPCAAEAYVQVAAEQRRRRLVLLQAEFGGLVGDSSMPWRHGLAQSAEVASEKRTLRREGPSE